MRQGLSYSEAGKLGAIAAADTVARKKQERIDAYNLDPLRCRRCDKPISYQKRYENKFCSSSCSASFYNEDRKVHTFCLLCGKQISWGNKYCSWKHMTEHKWQSTKDVLLNRGFDTTNNHKVAKRYLIELHKGACQICGLSEWGGKPMPLVLDHISGNSEDGNLSNLRVICNNCDALTPTYKAKNKGNGRAKRRQRYQEGKSY